jgi:hypothetical protein
MAILHYYRETEPPHSLLPSVKEQLKSLHLTDDADAIRSISTESCFNVQTSDPLDNQQVVRLEWLLAETFERQNLRLEKSAFVDLDSSAIFLDRVWAANVVCFSFLVECRVYLSSMWPFKDR